MANTLVTVRDYQNRFQLPPAPIPTNSPATFQPGTARYGEDVVRALADVGTR